MLIENITLNSFLKVKVYTYVDFGVTKPKTF